VRYVNRHRSQYEAGTSAVTRTSGCTWASGSNGIDASSGGKSKPSPDEVHAKVARSEETNPTTPGWSLGDLVKATARLGILFTNRTGQGWGAARFAHDSGLYLILQGDSDRFLDTTCSGAFDGDHAIGVHPNENAAGQWRIDDPICSTSRYESESRLRDYAEKLEPTVRFGVFTTAVPIVPPDTATEDAMLLTNAQALTGTATMIDSWRLWDVATDIATAPVAKGTKFDALGSVTYHKSAKNPTGFLGYLVNHAGRLHVLPSDRVSTFAKTSTTYPVTVGGKPAGTVTLP
jgi:hypothetical protein